MRKRKYNNFSKKKRNRGGGGYNYPHKKQIKRNNYNIFARKFR